MSDTLTNGQATERERVTSSVRGGAMNTIPVDCSELECLLIEAAQQVGVETGAVQYDAETDRPKWDCQVLVVDHSSGSRQMVRITVPAETIDIPPMSVVDFGGLRVGQYAMSAGVSGFWFRADAMRSTKATSAAKSATPEADKG